MSTLDREICLTNALEWIDDHFFSFRNAILGSYSVTVIHLRLIVNPPTSDIFVHSEKAIMLQQIGSSPSRRSRPPTPSPRRITPKGLGRGTSKGLGRGKP
ncbi:unnamed protein product [Adineta steineri]|uniref:Uncharacterized protein n=1 Tax=Adineta steineri TaxID=433720 RepID=A0A815Q8K9_9BILA|nr:unnamed protein product [Adineta steineri]CAF1632555.1 unnamed protein product [Adineta steineri]